jgi:hypothetical protein
MNRATIDRNAWIEVYEAVKILRKPSAFVRASRRLDLPYEAIRPGDWTLFESRGLSKRAFELLQEHSKLAPMPDHPGRWAIGL